mmetsp:Transcript_23560/g.57071  ORF Transcript_23560/g.57071 Transcript_23560/m.57071 type:complete len:524 (-) Transcript_23560:52-1623(-)
MRELRSVMRQEMVAQLSGEEMVPITWARVCDYCATELNDLWTTVEALQKRMKDDLKLDLTTEHIRLMLTKFNQLGACMYFNEPHLNEHVVLKPKVMIECVKSLIYDRQLHKQKERQSHMDGKKLDLWRRFSKTGLLHKTLLKDLWGSIGDKEVNEAARKFLMKLLEKHMLLAEAGETDFVVVPMLQDPFHTTPTDTIRVEIQSSEDASLILEIISQALGELGKWPYSSLPPQEVWLHPLSKPTTASPSTKIELKELREESARDGNHFFTHLCPISDKRVKTELKVFKDWDFVYSMLSRECENRSLNFTKFLDIVDNFKDNNQLGKLVRALFPDRKDEEDLRSSISAFGAANETNLKEGKLNLQLLKEILYIHRPSKTVSHDEVRKWIESIVKPKRSWITRLLDALSPRHADQKSPLSKRRWKSSAHQSSGRIQSQSYQARLDIIFKGFLPFAFYQMFVAWIIRFLNTLSRRHADQKSPLVGVDPVSFDLSKQKLYQSSCEFHFSVAGCGDIVFRVTGPPPLSR